MLLSHFAAFGQYDSLIHKPYAQRIAGYHELYLELINLKDSAAIAARAEKVKQFARSRHDRDLEMEMDLFMAYHDAFFKKLPSGHCIAEIQELITRSERENIAHINIRAVRVLALYYWDRQDFELAFEQYLLLDKKLSAQNVFDFPELVRDLLKIGEAYYYFQDFAQAKRYFERIVRLPETNFNTMFMNSARNTLGLCYQKEKDYRRSDRYFNEILKTRFEEPKKAWRRIAIGNLGANCYYRGEYEKAVPMLQYDFDGAVAESDFGPAAGASILLADIFLSTGKMDKSWQHVQYARENIEKAGQRDRLQFLYPVISKWYGARGRNHLSKMYLDSAVTAIHAYHEQFNAIKVLRAQQKINLQQEKLQHAERELQKELQENERVVNLAVILGLLVLLLLGYLIQRKNQLVKDRKIRAAQKELEAATLTLRQFTDSIAEKNQLIEQLQINRSEEEKNELISRLQRSSILTEDDWNTFQQTFDKAYPGFIHQAKSRYPDLSVGDLRYFLLCKLKLSYREMSAMLGVAPNTVQVLRHRIRKKLSLTSNEEVEQLIDGI